MKFNKTIQFELDSVPKDQRRGGIGLTLTWVGYVAVVVDLLVGGGLGTALPLSKAILAIVLGNLFLMLVASVSSYLSYKNGLTFALLTQKVFGKKFTIPLVLLVALTAIGWFSIQSSLFAHFIGVQFKLGSTSEAILGIILSLAMAITAFAGIDALRKLSIVAVPALVLVIIWTWLTVPKSGTSINSAIEMSMITAISSVIGSWIMGSMTTVGDLMRFAKSVKTAIAGAIIGIFANLILMILGAIAVNHYGTADLAEVLVGSVGFIGGLIFFTLNIWTTNDNAIYSAGLTTSVATNLSYRVSIIMAVVVAAIAVAFRPFQYEILVQWLQLLGKIIPPFGAVVFVTHLTYGKELLGKRHIISLISLALGLIVAFFLKFGIQPINGLLVAGFCQYILLKFAK